MSKGKRVIEAIKALYPSIKGGFAYWETDKDGSVWGNDIDGLKWENESFSKPTWSQITSNMKTETLSYKEEVVSLIKEECTRRIDVAYPEWKQRNYMAAVAEIHNKEIMAMKTIPFVAQYTLTADELATVKAADACKKAITSLRIKSNQLETSLDSMTLEQLKAFDPTDDRNWS